MSEYSEKTPCLTEGCPGRGERNVYCPACIKKCRSKTKDFLATHKPQNDSFVMMVVSAEHNCVALAARFDGTLTLNPGLAMTFSYEEYAPSVLITHFTELTGVTGWAAVPV